MRAVAFGELDDVKKFCEENPQCIFDVDAKGRTALDWARMTRKMDIIGYLTRSMTVYINEARGKELGLRTADTAGILKENAALAEKFIKAIRNRNTEDVMRLLSENTLTRASVSDFPGVVYFADTESVQGDTPLILAAGYNMISVVNELIAIGCPIDKANKYGHTAFTWACLCGHGEMVRTLLLLGADVRHKTAEGRTGLHYACLYAKARVIGIILDVMYERFGAWRSKNPDAIIKFNPARWSTYALTLESFLEVRWM